MKRLNLILIIVIIATTVLAGSVFYFYRDFGSKSKENILDKVNLIVVTSPQSGQAITNPLIITGKARGPWFFEASFPVKLIDDNNKVLATCIAQAKSDWMTEEFVPFEARLDFEEPKTKHGLLVLQKDNPSGLPEHDDELRIRVNFK